VTNLLRERNRERLERAYGVLAHVVWLPEERRRPLIDGRWGPRVVGVMSDAGPSAKAWLEADRRAA
jgi:hypothetical protein